MEILKAPDPVLYTMCDGVENPTSEKVADLAAAMIKTMMRHNGAGLAAPQVGITKRLFVMKYGMSPLVCINPEITRRGKDATTSIEGCLSIPGKQFRVTRSKIIELTYTTLNGTRKTTKMRGMDARVAQHELDHLDGILIG